MTQQRTHHRHRVRPIAKGRRIDVRREELNRLIDLLNDRAKVINQLVETQNRILEDQRVQFARIAQMQAELDLIRKRLRE